MRYPLAATIKCLASGSEEKELEFVKCVRFGFGCFGIGFKLVKFIKEGWL